MPIYDFTCTKCGDFEVTRRMSERNDALTCPSCGLSATRIAGGVPSYGGATNADDDSSAGGYGMRHAGSCLCCR
ncbi:zinc ribbon domain-containing protein [Paraburkholderia sp.]|uniref:FmdB family zinc ribbon protein n=1 Tax=Paraburkholderia sp. TaxID=1926495 RepID=UPI002F3E4B4A